MSEGATEVPTLDPGSAEQEDSWGLFLMMVALFLSISVTYVLLRTRFRFLPESIAVIIIGIVIGLIVKAANKEVNSILALDSESFFLFLLPPIIFESGYNLHKGNFFANIFTITIFAVIGTIISTAVVGGGIYLFGLIPSVGYNIPLLECLVFGALISAVDPVATLAIFSALDVEPTLHMLVFGESVLNDAVAVVLYRTLLNFIQAEFTPQLVGLAFLQFFTSFFGSALLGIAFSLVSALVLKHVNFRRYSSLEIAVVIVFAYAPYLMAEAVGLSGIMAILFAGIGMSHYTFFNLSPISQITTEKVFRSLAFLAETSVFAYLGLAVPSYEHVFNISLVSVTLFLIIVGRALNVFPLSFITNFFRKTKINKTMQLLMFFSGLRGAIAFSLALSMKNFVTNYEIILTTTLSVVIFTIVVFGGGTFPLIRVLERCSQSSILLKKVDMVAARERQGSMEQVSDGEGRGEPSWFERLDNRYLIKWFRKPVTSESYRSAINELREMTRVWPVISDEHLGGLGEVDIHQESVLAVPLSEESPKKRRPTRTQHQAGSDSEELLPEFPESSLLIGSRLGEDDE